MFNSNEDGTNDTISFGLFRLFFALFVSFLN